MKAKDAMILWGQQEGAECEGRGALAVTTPDTPILGAQRIRHGELHPAKSWRSGCWATSCA